jgi:hypothetical protein
MRYILVYFALVLGLSGFSLLWAGHAYGFLLLVIAAALIYVLLRRGRTRRRERRYGGSGEASAGTLVEAPVGLETECARLEVEISGVKAKLETAAQTHLPSCLLEIKGPSAEAEESVKRVRALLASNSGPMTDVPLGHAEIERPERIATRARELAAQARTELQQPQPDWFRVAALAQRVTQMAQELGAVSPPGTAPLRGVVRPDVEAARARAEAALGGVRPIVAEADALLGEDNMARICLEHGQQAYDDAVAVQTRLAAADDPEAAGQAAIDGFRLAEESAAAAHDHALGLPARAGTQPSARGAAKLLFGAIGRPFAAE